MMRHLLVLAGIVAACVLAGIVVVGCLGKPSFECASNTECRGGATAGTCEPNGFCSFTDSTCPSGRRYGDLSGPNANDCVPLPPDAPPDMFVPDEYVHDARECFASGAYELCFAMMPPMGDVTLAGALDTDTDTRCVAMPASWATAGQPDACLIMGNSVSVTGTVTVTGGRPLVLLGERIAINATLDVSSKKGQPAGAGASTQVCAAFPQAPSTNVAGAGGGAGGSFRTAGGNGGLGKGSSLNGLSAPGLTANPTVLRAGCPGQTGGTGTAPAGTPGNGGGAVFLTASRITFGASGAINASGAGAIATNLFSGGSGGGSGGMIVLHAADTISAAAGAKLLANGGGGASGAASSAVGADGADPNLATPTTGAPGGDAGNTAGRGGAGATTAAGVNGQDAQAAGGNRDTGGGGGGGGGYIQTNKQIAGIQASPTPTLIP